MAAHAFFSGCYLVSGQYWRRIEDPSLPTVILYGHYDVQPIDPLELWVSPPFEPTVRKGRLYARGVGDNKGQHAANLFALESLIAVNGKLPCNVIFLFEGEEETGSPHIATFIEEFKDELQADLVIVSDGPVNGTGQQTIEYGVRGVIYFELRAKGPNRDLHSGNWGNVAPNPLWKLVNLLGTMKNAQGEITIDGFYDNIEPPTELEHNALAKLPSILDEMLAELEIDEMEFPDKSYYDCLALMPSFSINGIHGGYGGPGSKTVLPSEAVAKCDIRIIHDQSTKEILDKVEAHVKKHAPDVEFVRGGGMEPSKTPLDSPYATVIRQAISAAQGEEPLDTPPMGGSLPIYGFTKILELPTFVIPYANADEDNHSPNENLELWRIPNGIKTGASLLLHIGNS
ncbi:MAG: M20 family dipeptidase [Aestuariibacter sp.]|nr:M20 family dipeptidase [Aestuariibacter sp.]